MERADKGLAFMLQYENVAWYDSGEVRILDRRVYPRKVEFVVCKTHRRGGAGDYRHGDAERGSLHRGGHGHGAGGATNAANMASDGAAGIPARHAAYTISHARPTTAARMTLIVRRLPRRGEAGRSGGKDVATRPSVEHAVLTQQPAATTRSTRWQNIWCRYVPERRRRS